MRKKICVISTRVFWPTNSGHKVVLYNYCKGLYEIYKCDIYLYTFLENNERNDTSIPYFIKEVNYASDISILNKISNVWNMNILNNMPLQCSLYYSKKNEKDIEVLLNRVKPDIVMIDMIRLSMYKNAIKDKNIKKLIYIEDLLSKRYALQIGKDKHKSNIAGNYSNNFPGWLNIVINRSNIKNMILKLESIRCKKLEKKCYDQFDTSILISKIETDELNNECQGNKAICITMGVDYNYFSQNLNIKKTDGLISFFGNFYYDPNVASLEIIINKIFPYIKKIKPNAKLKIVGKCPENIILKYKNEKSILITGEVEDLRREVLESEVILAPVAYGTGIKTKILEGMAMGVPVVTNSLGVEGINIDNGKNIFVSDDYKTLAKQVVRLLDNYQLRKEIGFEAQKFINEKHMWEKTLKNFKQII